MGEDKKEEAAEYLRRIKEKLKYYKQVVIASSDAIIIQDFNGIIRAWNSGATRIYGFNEGEMIGQSITKIISPEDRAEAIKNINTIKEGKPTFKIRQTRITKNKKKVFVNITYSPIYEDEEIIEIGTTEEDITELKNSETRFHTLFNNASDAIWLLDGDRFIECNLGAVQLFNCKNPLDIINHTPMDFSPAKQPDGQDSKKKARNYIQAALCGHPQRFYWQHLTNDKILIDTEIALNKLTLGGKNYLQAMGRDITERKKAEEKLRENETRFKELFENMEECVVMYEIKNNGNDIIIKDLNISAEKLEKVKKEEIIGKKVETVFKGVKEFGLYDVFKKVWKTGKSMQHPISFYIDKYHHGWRENFVYKLPTGELVAIYSDVTERKKAEEALKIKNIVFDVALASNSISDSKGILTEVNSQFLKLTGFSKKEEVIGKSVSNFFSRESDVNIVINSLKKTGKWSGEILAKRKDGSTFSIYGSASVLLDDRGKIMGYQSSMYDITERKKIEEELKKSKENVDLLVKERTVELEKQTTFLSSVLENVPDMIFVKDAKNLKFELFNKAGEELLGYKHEQLIGKSDRDFFPKSQADFFIQKDRDVLASKKLLDIPEEPIDTKNGRRYLHTKKIPIIEEGKARYLMGISEDITERKKTESDYKILIQTMTAGFITTNETGKILNTNKSYCDMVGYSQEQLLKMNLQELDVGESKDFKEHMLKIIENGRGKFETQHKNKNGKIIDVEVTASYIKNHPSKMLAIISDISERKKYERELLSRTRELERFNDAAIDRELKMVELKKKLAALEAEK